MTWPRDDNPLYPCKSNLQHISAFPSNLARCICLSWLRSNHSLEGVLDRILPKWSLSTSLRLTESKARVRNGKGVLCHVLIVHGYKPRYFVSFLTVAVMHPEFKNTWTPAVNVLTWFMLVTAILSVLTRLGTKYFIFRKWTFDDGLATTSMVFCIAQSIAVSMATKNGLGQHRDMLSDLRVESMMKV